MTPAERRAKALMALRCEIGDAISRAYDKDVTETGSFSVGNMVDALMANPRIGEALRPLWREEAE